VKRSRRRVKTRVGMVFLPMCGRSLATLVGARAASLAGI
jgi:hypothetical protein